MIRSMFGGARHGLLSLGLMSLLLGFASRADAVFTVSSVANIENSSNPPSSSGMAVQNTSTPVWNVVYRSMSWVRYAKRTGATGTWSIDSSLTGNPLAVAIEIASSSPFYPRIAMVSKASGDPWVRYATNTGSSWSYETIVQRASSGDTIIDVGASTSIAMFGQTPYVAYTIQ